MKVSVHPHPARTNAIAVLCLVLAVGWMVYQSRENTTQPPGPAQSRASARERPRLDRHSLPPAAHQQPANQLRAWAAAMTDEELSRMVSRVWADLPAEDKDPDPATKTLLCVLFREWGRRNPTAAFAALDGLHEDRYAAVEEGRMFLVRHQQEWALQFAIWAGYGEHDPAGAWAKLGEPADPAWPFRVVDSAEMFSVLSHVYNQVLERSPELLARSLPDEHRFRNVALRFWLAGIDDPEQRLAEYHRLKLDAAKALQTVNRSDLDAILAHPSRTTAGLQLNAQLLAGLVARNPEQAWESLDYMSNDMAFLTVWVTDDPDQALAFFETKSGEEGHLGLKLCLFGSLVKIRPEQTIAYLSNVNLPDQLMIAETGHWRADSQWPVVEGMSPGIPDEELKQRLRQALEDYPLSPKAHQSFVSEMKLND